MSTKNKRPPEKKSAPSKQPAPPPAKQPDPAPTLSLGDLKQDPANCRRHNPRNIGAIVNTLQQVGFARSIVVDENLKILAGNGAVEAAGEAGIEKVRVIQASGNEVIAVQRVGLTDEQKAKLAIADNRTGELADWDAGQLLETIGRYQINPADVEFTQAELDVLSNAAAAAAGVSDGGSGAGDGASPEADTQVVVGAYRFTLERGKYEKWLEDLRVAAGFDKPSVIAEIQRRLGLTE